MGGTAETGEVQKMLQVRKWKGRQGGSDTKLDWEKTDIEFKGNPL